MKSNKGITLVALVITIIVLLILAGVSISMVVGENGVLNRAKDATDKTAKAQAQEALETAVSGMQGLYADAIANGTSDTFLAFLKTKEATDIEGQMNGYTVSTWNTTGENIVVEMKKTGTDKPVYKFNITKVSDTNKLGVKVVEDKT